MHVSAPEKIDAGLRLLHPNYRSKVDWRIAQSTDSASLSHLPAYSNSFQFPWKCAHKIPKFVCQDSHDRCRLTVIEFICPNGPTNINLSDVSNPICAWQ